MENMKQELELMEAAPLFTGRADVFLTHKINIQSALHNLSENSPEGFEVEVKEMYFEWRQLGTKKGTLQGYIAAMNNLKHLIGKIEASQRPVF